MLTSIIRMVDETRLDKMGVDERVLDKTGLDELGPNWDQPGRNRGRRRRRCYGMSGRPW